MSRKTTNGENTGRNYSWALPAVLIIILAASIVGLIAYVGDIKENSRQQAIDEYTSRLVEFTVFGDGEYSPDIPTYRFTFSASPEDARGLMGELTALGLKPSKKTAGPFDDSTKTIVEVDSERPENVIALAEDMGLAYACAYVQKDALASVGYAYDDAYDAALAKATMVAGNTGLPWRIVKVTELDSSFDSGTGKTSSRVSMTLAVDGNVGSDN